MQHDVRLFGGETPALDLLVAVAADPKVEVGSTVGQPCLRISRSSTGTDGPMLEADINAVATSQLPRQLSAALTRLWFSISRDDPASHR